MDFPTRKQIRLPNFDCSQSNIYFLTICTHNRARLFGEIASSELDEHLLTYPNHPEQIIEKWLFEIENKYLNSIIDAYVIMPDHVHFILYNPGIINETGEHIGSPLPEIIKWFKTQTTNEYIRGVKNGLFPYFEKHLWQRNYYEHIIRNEADLQTRRKYIYDNPLKWLFPLSPPRTR